MIAPLKGLGEKLQGANGTDKSVEDVKTILAGPNPQKSMSNMHETHKLDNHVDIYQKKRVNTVKARN